STVEQYKIQEFGIEHPAEAVWVGLCSPQRFFEEVRHHRVVQRKIDTVTTDRGHRVDGLPDTQLAKDTPLFKAIRSDVENSDLVPARARPHSAYEKRRESAQPSLTPFVFLRCHPRSGSSSCASVRWLVPSAQNKSDI